MIVKNKIHYIFYIILILLGFKTYSQNIMGIDVAHHQGTINWSEVKNLGGKEFAWVKATEGYSGSGSQDPNFISNMSNGINAGLVMGAYHFARPDNNSPEQDAENFLNVASNYIGDGFLPPVIDIENIYDGSGILIHDFTQELTSSEFTNWVQTWIDTVESQTGVAPIIYANLSYTNHFETSINNYGLWVAAYSYTPTNPPTDLGAWSDWLFLQYSETGSVPGIIGDVDLNVFNGSIDDFNVLVGINTVLDCNNNYEPNNSQSQAFLFSSIGKDFSTYTNLEACLSHNLIYEDWYLIGATAQGQLNIILTDQTDDFEIELYSEGASTPFEQGIEQSNGDITLEWCSPSSACTPLYIRVFKEQFSTPSTNPNYNYNLILDWDYNVNCSTSGRQFNSSSTQNNNLTITGNTNICIGQSTTLTVSGGTGNYQWFLNGSEIGTGSSITLNSLSSGNNTINVVDLDSACNTGSATVIVTQDVTANAGSNVTIQNGGSTTLQGSGGSSCSWSPTTGLSNPNSCTPTASPSQTTTYTLTVTENGCTDTDTVTITVNGSNGNPPPNDNCSNATTLNSNTSCNFTSGTVENATPSVGANHCDGCSCTSPDDYDVYYKFTAIKTSHTVTVSNYASNFDAVIELRTSCSSGSSNYISCYDPSGAPTSVSETWDNLNIGQTYYIRVFEWNYQGTPPNANTFNICVTHNNTGGQGIDLISNITSVSDSNPDVGDSIDVTFTITNNGDENVNDAFVGGLYLSTNQTYSSSDDIFSGSTQGFTAISSGQTLTINKTITIPNVSDGQYYILSNPDIGNNIIEIEEDNNYSSYLIQIGQIVQNGPDLDITGMSVTPNSGLVPGQEVTIELDIENEGNEDSSSFDVLIFLDIDGDNDYDSNEFMGEFNFGSLDAGEDNTITQGFDLPANIPSTGVYELFAIADSNNAINETDEGNNDKDRNITIALASGGSEDITVINSSVAESSVNAGGTINVISNHIYLGNQTSSELPTLHLGYYLSADCDFSYAEDVFLDDDSSNLGINNPNIEEDEILTIPPATSSGTYYILFVADSENLIDEGTLENNNVECIQITVNGTSTPEGDIFITDELCNPTDVIIGSELEVFYNLNYAGNQTNVDLPSIEVFYFLSNDCGLSNDDILVSDDSISLGSDLPVNDVDERIELPNNLSAGTYYIIFRADMENAVYEVNENNNTACVEFNLLPADASYQDVTLSSPYVEVTEANVGDQVYVSVYQNYTGYQTDADLSSVQMQYYLSTDCTLSSDDYHFGNDYSSIGSDDPSQFEYDTVTIPSGISLGIYYILFVADTENIVNENNENNNLECIQIIINDDALGIDDNELNNQIKIYPNPVSDILTINLGKTHSEISLEIYNVVGQRIRTSEYNNKRILTINTSSFSNGIYFFKIKTDTIKSKEFKIIKE